ncbi:MAG: DUF4198 domain-containing protein [Thermodesulfobacteriota bacterium]
MARGLAPGRVDTYDPKHVTSIRAFDADGKEIPVRRRDDAQRARFTTEGEPAMVSVTCEWGDRVNTPEGKKFLSRKQAMERGIKVVSAFSSTQFTKSFFRWGTVWEKPIGLKLEIVLLARPDSLRPGGKLPVQILFEGLPLAGSKVGIGQSKIEGTTDKDGVAHIQLQGKGLQVIMATHNVPVEDTPGIDYRQFMTFLTFMLP